MLTGTAVSGTEMKEICFLKSEVSAMIDIGKHNLYLFSHVDRPLKANRREEHSVIW